MALAERTAGREPIRRAKVTAFEGVRGIACVLVVLSHIWVLVPWTSLDDSGPLQGFTMSGNLAVSVFLVLGGFLVTRTLDTQLMTAGTIAVGRFWFRRLVRLGAHLVPFMAVLALVAWLDPRNPYSASQTRNSLVGIATFTLNLRLISNAGDYRPDIGPLWYLSVEQQFYAVFVFLFVFVARFRLVLIAGLVAGAVAMWVWRVHALNQDGWWPASLRTTTRADGLLLGSAAGLAYPYLRPYVRLARLSALPLLVSLGAFVLTASTVDAYAYLGAYGSLFAAVTTLFVLALAVGRNPAGRAERAISVRWARIAGMVSFPLYIWHVPVFYAADRWIPSWHWLSRTVLALVALGMIVTAAHNGIERRFGRWLDRTRGSRSRAQPNGLSRRSA